MVTMKQACGLAAAAFGATLAVLLVQRLSEQTSALIVGVLIGALASVPATAAVLIVSLRSRAPDHWSSQYQPAPRSEHDRFVILPAPYPAQPSTYPAPVAPPVAPVRVPREFTVIGDADPDDT